MDTSKKPFYQKEWFMWITLIFLPPLGIVIVWMNQALQRVIKVMLTLLAVCAMLAWYYSGQVLFVPQPKSSLEEVVPDPEETEQNEPQEQSETNVNTSGRDYDMAIAQLNATLDSLPEFDYVENILVSVSEESGAIRFQAVVADGTKTEEVIYFAQALLIYFNELVKEQDESIATASSGYYGGLYDEFSFLMAIAEQSFVQNPADWMIHMQVPAGSHTEIKTQTSRAIKA